MYAGRLPLLVLLLQLLQRCYCCCDSTAAVAAGAKLLLLLLLSLLLLLQHRCCCSIAAAAASLLLQHFCHSAAVGTVLYVGCLRLCCVSVCCCCRLLSCLLSYRASHKFLNTYFVSLPSYIFTPTQRIHVSFLQTGGWMSCSCLFICLFVCLLLICLRRPSFGVSPFLHCTIHTMPSCLLAATCSLSETVSSCLCL